MRPLRVRLSASGLVRPASLGYFEGVRAALPAADGVGETVEPIRTIRSLVLPVLAAGAAACTWVPLTEQAEGVRIVAARDVTSCQKVGRTTSQTADQVGIFSRTDYWVGEELKSLARNEAADLGGDAIVPLGPPAEGRQSFDIYRCSAR